MLCQSALPAIVLCLSGQAVARIQAVSGRRAGTEFPGHVWVRLGKRTDPARMYSFRAAYALT